ncbi:FtsK/SpoIIIE domain-containing protein, partial [Streptomyces sp. NEAU-S77]|uniref:FtsK/SpoIIIE domain-containing protein n=1 Tax=Streptomyces sp. NEAU-S77 TaxID=3411033 RepID=UPI003BA32559
GGSAPYGGPHGATGRHPADDRGLPGQSGTPAPGGTPGDTATDGTGSSRGGRAGAPTRGAQEPWPGDGRHPADRGTAGQPGAAAGPERGGPADGSRSPHADPTDAGTRGATDRTIPGQPGGGRRPADHRGTSGNTGHPGGTDHDPAGQRGGPAGGNGPYGAQTGTGPRGTADRNPGAHERRPADDRGPTGQPGTAGGPAAGGSAPYDGSRPGPDGRSAAPTHGGQERWPGAGTTPADRRGAPGGAGRPSGSDHGPTGQSGAAADAGSPYSDRRHGGPPGTPARPGAPYTDAAGPGQRDGDGWGPAGQQSPAARDAGSPYSDRHPGGPPGTPAHPGAPYADTARPGQRGGDGWGPAGQQGPAAGGGTPYGDPADTGPHGAADQYPGAQPGAPTRPGAPAVGRGGRGTPLRGTTVPRGLGEAGTYAYDAPGAQVRRRGIGAWVRQLTGGRGADARGADEAAGAEEAAARAAEEAAALHRRWPDPAAVLMTALGPGPRLWERGPGHPDALTVRLGSADRLSGAGGLLPAAPVTVDLRQAGSLGLAGPRGRLAGLARSVVAQLAALHSPGTLEIVLLSTEDRPAEWSWLGWLPQLQPLRGQDCRLLLAYDAEQVTARTAELTRRLDDTAAGAAAGPAGPYTVVIVDGDPGPPALRETLARLAAGGPGAGIHLLCLAEAPAASPASPLSVSYETACAGSAAFASCEVAALLSGDVATGLQIVRRDAATGGAGVPMWVAGATTAATVDAVSGAWAERFARALAPLRPAASTHGDEGGPGRQVSAPLPDSARLLDELGLARATPASLMARWAAAADEVPAGGRALAVLGAGPRGPVAVDLAADGPHLLIDGGPGTGKTELLRSLAASLAAAERPDRLELVLLDGAGASGGAERGEGLRVCTDLPHVSTYLAASDPVRMREFAQALSSELKRRAELLGRLDFVTWHTRLREGTGAPGGAPPRVISPRSPGDIDPPPSTTLKLRPQRGRQHDDSDQPAAPRPFPRLVVLVDDFDALVAPALGSPGRPAAGSVVRALEAIARDGAHLGVHLVAASGRPDRTADTAAVERAGLRIVLEPRPLGPASSERPEAEPHTSDASAESGGEHAPGRGRLLRPDDAAATPFQAGRVTGRIPRTATQRPTVVPLEWERMGDPPARRPLRELGNGPTDLALLASALQRAAQSADAPTAPALI